MQEVRRQCPSFSRLREKNLAKVHTIKCETLNIEQVFHMVETTKGCKTAFDMVTTQKSST